MFSALIQYHKHQFLSQQNLPKLFTQRCRSQIQPLGNEGGGLFGGLGFVLFFSLVELFLVFFVCLFLIKKHHQLSQININYSTLFFSPYDYGAAIVTPADSVTL